MSELIVAVPVTVSYRASCCAAGRLCEKHRAVHTGMGLSPALTQLNPCQGVPVQVWRHCCLGRADLEQGLDTARE